MAQTLNAKALQTLALWSQVLIQMKLQFSPGK